MLKKLHKNITSKKIITYSITFLLFSIAFFIYSYKIDTTYRYHPDFARDMHDILKITQGDFTLLGPKLTFGGLYTAAYYYYLFTPIFFITKANIQGILYFNSLLFSLGVAYFLKKVYENYSLWKSLIATTVLSILPLYVLASRDPSNAYTYMPLLLIYLTYIYFHKIQSRFILFVLGLFLGIIMNFHFINAVLFLPLVIYLLFYLKDKKNIIFFIVGTAAAFLPLVLFELKHNFIMFTNTFIHKSYLNWVNNKNIPNGLEGKKNIFTNMIFMSEQMKPFTIINPIIGYILLAILYIRKQIQKKDLLFGLMALFSFILFSTIIRFQFISHYIYSTAFFLVFALLLTLLKTRYAFLLVIFLLFEIFSFPTHIYNTSSRNAIPFEKAVNYVVENKILDKNTKFNVLQVSKIDLLAPIGFEYRFFLRKNGYIPDSEFAYNTSRILLIFSEIPDLDINSLSSWEVQQFGKDNFAQAKRYDSGEITIFKVIKNE